MLIQAVRFFRTVQDKELVDYPDNKIGARNPEYGIIIDSGNAIIDEDGNKVPEVWDYTICGDALTVNLDLTSF